jgi:hypothetical protein
LLQACWPSRRFQLFMLHVLLVGIRTQIQAAPRAAALACTSHLRSSRGRRPGAHAESVVPIWSRFEAVICSTEAVCCSTWLTVMAVTLIPTHQARALCIGWARTRIWLVTGSGKTPARPHLTLQRVVLQRCAVFGDATISKEVRDPVTTHQCSFPRKLCDARSASTATTLQFRITTSTPFNFVHAVAALNLVRSNKPRVSMRLQVLNTTA